MLHNLDSIADLFSMRDNTLIMIPRVIGGRGYCSQLQIVCDEVLALADMLPGSEPQQFSSGPESFLSKRQPSAVCTNNVILEKFAVNFSL